MEFAEDWFEGQSICVTGVEEALGRRLVRRVVRGGSRRVVGLERQPTVLYNDGIQSRGVKYVVGNILNPSELEGVLRGCTSLTDEAFKEQLLACTNPCGAGNAGQCIADVLATLEIGHSLVKKKMMY